MEIMEIDASKPKTGVTSVVAHQFLWGIPLLEKLPQNNADRSAKLCWNCVKDLTLTDPDRPLCAYLRLESTRQIRRQWTFSLPPSMITSRPS